MNALRHILRRLRVAIGRTSVTLPILGGSVSMVLDTEETVERPESKLKAGRVELDPKRYGPKAEP